MFPPRFLCDWKLLRVWFGIISQHFAINKFVLHYWNLPFIFWTFSTTNATQASVIKECKPFLSTDFLFNFSNVRNLSLLLVWLESNKVSHTLLALTLSCRSISCNINCCAMWSNYRCIALWKLKLISIPFIIELSMKIFLALSNFIDFNLTWFLKVIVPSHKVTLKRESRHNVDVLKREN